MTASVSRASRKLRLAALFAVLVASLSLPAASRAAAGDRFITLASTTSTEASGLFEHLLPKFREESGIDVRVVAVGTGKALRIARAGDADALLVHDRPSEERFVAEGYGLERREVMYNDFILVGPQADPAGVRAAKGVAEALRMIAAARAFFLSRGDDSGTHKAELRLWDLAKIDPRGASGRWYRETGSGMGKTLNTAAAMPAYTITDRGTWLSFRNRGDLAILFQGDPPLFNQYSAIVVDPERHAHVKADDARRFVDWLVSKRGQRAIGEFRLNGTRLFEPNADAEGLR